MGEFSDRHRHYQPEEEDEEALSLCDLQLEDGNEVSEMGTAHSRRTSSSSSSSEPPEFFEFFSNFTASEMCSAEDIIFCGKLIPFKDHSPALHSRRLDKRNMPPRRRSESLSGLRLNSSSVAYSIGNIDDGNKLMMRNSRSLDYRKSERLSSSKTSPETDKSVERNNSKRSRGKCDQMTQRTVAKPRWYLLMFGVVRPPTEMELKDIKSRQIRRNNTTATLPPSVADSVKKPPVGKGSCKLINVLSCKDPTSVAVTTSLRMPPA